MLWKSPLGSPGLGGVAATSDYVLVSERAINNTFDVFKCLKADNGEEVWALRYPANGELDYGSSPRTTPLIVGDLVFLYGAFGHLHCVELKTGNILWQMDVRSVFNVQSKLPWGQCGTPLFVDGKLLVLAGGPEASLVALEPKSGKILWKTPGEPASYGSLNVGTFHGRKQIIGHDATTLGGWDIETGKRLWTVKPKKDSDYNVPTPIPFNNQLIVATENNGTRLYVFNPDGTIIPEPVAVNKDLAPETHTPVVVGKYLYGIWKEMVCLDLSSGLKTTWTNDDSAFSEHTSIFAAEDRLLVSTMEGELLLIRADPKQFQLLGRMKAFEGEKGLYSHPAIVGNRLYYRSSDSIVCIELPK
ncbi:MAG TPA: PQQ-like beta-propeller repeat protein [Gemmatales bacterium]|nr:PQQ-like beta-propeller repeat protein [Gemmatales bacterium]